MAAMVQDRGYAWVVCAASLMILIVDGGLMCVTGILYILFKNGIDASDEALSLITSLNIGIGFMVCEYTESSDQNLRLISLMY